MEFIFNYSRDDYVISSPPGGRQPRAAEPEALGRWLRFLQQEQARSHLRRGFRERERGSGQDTAALLQPLLVAGEAGTSCRTGLRGGGARQHQEEGPSVSAATGGCQCFKQSCSLTPNANH